MAVHAEGKFTTMDIVRGTVLHLRRTFVWLSCAGGFALISGVLLGFRDPKGWRGQWVLIVSGLFLLVYMWPVVYYGARRRVKGAPNLRGVVRYEFGDEGWSVVAPHSTSEIKWSAATKWKEGKYCFLIYPGGHIIPKRFFESSADVDAVRGLLQTNVKA